MLLFTASDLASITSHVHNWVLLWLWLLPFILSGVISPLISSSILGTYWPGEFLFQYPIFFFPVMTVCHTVMYGHVWMWELDYEESWELKNWCFWTVVLEKTLESPLWCWRRLLESPLNCNEIQPVHPKGHQSWVFIGRTDAKAEIPILWPPRVKSWLTVKAPDAGRDCGQEEKGMLEGEMVGWHHQLNGQEFE